MAPWVAEHQCSVVKAKPKKRPVPRQTPVEMPVDPVANYFGPPLVDRVPLTEEELADLVRGINEGQQQADLFDPNDEFRADTFGT